MTQIKKNILYLIALIILLLSVFLKNWDVIIITMAIFASIFRRKYTFYLLIIGIILNTINNIFAFNIFNLFFNIWLCYLIYNNWYYLHGKTFKLYSDIDYNEYIIMIIISFILTLSINNFAINLSTIIYMLNYYLFLLASIFFINRLFINFNIFLIAIIYKIIVIFIYNFNYLNLLLYSLFFLYILIIFLHYRIKK